MKKIILLGMLTILLSGCSVFYEEATKSIVKNTEYKENVADFLISLNPSLIKTESYEALYKIETRLREMRDNGIRSKAKVEIMDGFSDEQEERVNEPLNRIIGKIDEYLQQERERGSH